MQNSGVHSSSLFMTVSATVRQADLSIDHSVLTPETAEISDDLPTFTARYGDMFCRACTRGGMFVGVMRIATYSDGDANSIELELKGSYGLFSAEAAVKFAKVSNTAHASEPAYLTSSTSSAGYTIIPSA
jgi:hypothetical protein